MDERTLAIHHVRGRLQRRTAPRLHMVALVGTTAACGLLASFLVLRAGLSAMALRYPLAVGLAYVAFLGLVHIWLRRFRLRNHDDAEPRGEEPLLDLDVVEIPFDEMWRTPEPDSTPHFGGGGGFGGAGAGRSWSGPPTLEHPSASLSTVGPVRVASSAGGSSRGAEGWELDLGEGALWLIPVTIITAIAVGVLIYVVYIAPALFAELLLDAAMAAGLYHRLTQVSRRSWLVTAIRNTIGPAVSVAALLALAGAIMQSVYPDAVSIGRVAQYVVHRADETVFVRHQH